MPQQIKMPTGKIGPQFTRKVLPWVETFWHNNKRYPSDIELSRQFGFGPDELMRLRASKFYNNCLEARGIRQNSEFFTDKQVAAMTMVTNFSDARPVEAKLASIGVTPETYHGWLSDPAFKREIQARADDILDNVFPEAQAALAKQVKNGNINALKFYYEITGRAASPEAINLKMTMAKMIEAVQKHVRDPAILQAIAAELNAVGPSVAEVSIPVTSVPSVKELYLANHNEGI